MQKKARSKDKAGVSTWHNRTGSVSEVLGCRFDPRPSIAIDMVRCNCSLDLIPGWGTLSICCGEANKKKKKKKKREREKREGKKRRRRHLGITAEEKQRRETWALAFRPITK